MADRPASPVNRLAYLVAVAVLLGLAASLLLTAPPSSAGVQLLPEVQVGPTPGWVGPLLILLFVGPMFAMLIVRRLVYGGVEGSQKLGAVVLLLVMIGILVALHFAPIGPGPTPSPVTPGGTNQSCPPTTPGCPGYGGTGAGGAPPTLAAPAWQGYLIYGLIAVGVLVAAALIPRAQGFLRGSRAVESPTGPPPPRLELEAALQRVVARTDADDARTRIIRAYGSLLERAGRRLPRLETATPREIARELSTVYGIPEGTAGELTGLFEEARYSRARRMADDAVPRAEAALRRALSEISDATPGAR